MRKILGIVALLCSAIFISACGGSSATSSSIGSRHAKAPMPTTTSASTSSTSTPAAVAPAAGTQLASFSGRGRVNVITNGNGFSIIDSLIGANNADQSTVTSYDAAGNQLTVLAPGSLTGECGAADVVVPGQGRLLIGYLVTNIPSQGIQPATVSTQIKAWNAQTGAEVWSTKLFNSAPNSDPNGLECNSNTGVLQDFNSTPNGLWGVEASDTRNGGYVIDLTNGAVRQDPNAFGTLGNSVVDDPKHDPGNDHAVFNLTNPTTGAVVGRVSSAKIGLGYLGDIAPSGVFTSGSADESAQSGTSPDGSRLLAIAQNDINYGPKAITGYGLPSMRVLWTKTVDQPWFVGDSGDVLVVEAQNCPSDGAACLVGFNDRNGVQLWKVPSGTVCGMTNSQMLIQVNGDLAVIDLRTGRQLSYTPTTSSDCPEIDPGGIEVNTGADNGDPTVTQTLSVRQVLAP